MTINGIGSSGMAALCMSPEARVAAMLVTNDAHEQQLDQQMLDSARAEYAEQSQAQVDAMHAEASAIRHGAWVELGVMAVGFGIQGYALYGEGTCEPNSGGERFWQTVGGLGQSASNGLAGNMYKRFADAPIAEHRADAQAASSAATEAEWEIGDRDKAISESKDDQQQTVAWLGKMVDSEAAVNTAILSNMA